jgi:hypothetical protein
MAPWGYKPPTDMGRSSPYPTGWRLPTPIVRPPATRVKTAQRWIGAPTATAPGAGDANQPKSLSEVMPS